RQGRTGARAARRLWHGVVGAWPVVLHALGHCRGHDVDARRLLRRPVRGSVECAAAAARVVGDERPADGDEQLRQHAGGRARFGRSVALPQRTLDLSPVRIIVVFSILTLVSSVYVLAIVPEFFVRFSLWLLTHTIYRIRIIGEENVPFRGP